MYMKTFDKIALGAATVGLVGTGAVFAASDTKLSIQVNDGVRSVDIVDSNGDTVANPAVAMSAITFSFNDQKTTGTLGTADEKIRLNNPTGVPTWSVSIAATNGASSLWDDGAGNTMDYNDASGGQLSLNPSAGAVVEANGGATTGVTLGSSAAFEEGVIDSITLYSADATAAPFAQYDLTGVDVSQLIPGKTKSASYTLSLTLTAV